MDLRVDFGNSLAQYNALILTCALSSVDAKPQKNQVTLGGLQSSSKPRHAGCNVCKVNNKTICEQLHIQALVFCPHTVSLLKMVKQAKARQKHSFGNSIRDFVYVIWETKIGCIVIHSTNKIMRSHL